MDRFLIAKWEDDGRKVDSGIIIRSFKRPRSVSQISGCHVCFGYGYSSEHLRDEMSLPSSQHSSGEGSIIESCQLWLVEVSSNNRLVVIVCLVCLPVFGTNLPPPTVFSYRFTIGFPPSYPSLIIWYLKRGKECSDVGRKVHCAVLPGVSVFSFEVLSDDSSVQDL